MASFSSTLLSVCVLSVTLLALAPASLASVQCVLSACDSAVKFGLCPNGTVANVNGCNCYCGKSGVPCPPCDTTSPQPLSEPDHDIGRTFTLNYYDPTHSGCVESDILHRRVGKSGSPITESNPILSGACYADPSASRLDNTLDWLNLGDTFVAVPSFFRVFIHEDRAYLYASCTDGTCSSCRTALIVSDGQCVDTTVFNNDPNQRVAGVKINFGKTLLPVWQIVVITSAVLIFVAVVAIGTYLVVRSRRADAQGSALLPPWKFGNKGSGTSASSNPAEPNAGILDE